MNNEVDIALSNLMRLNGRSDTAYQHKLSKILKCTDVNGSTYFEKEALIRFISFRDLLTPENPPNYDKYRASIDATDKHLSILSKWYKDVENKYLIDYNSVNIGTSTNMKLSIALTNKMN